MVDEYFALKMSSELLLANVTSLMKFMTFNITKSIIKVRLCSLCTKLKKSECEMQTHGNL
jgi:hypothetical protein